VSVEHSQKRYRSFTRLLIVGTQCSIATRTVHSRRGKDHRRCNVVLRPTFRNGNSRSCTTSSLQLASNTGVHTFLSFTENPEPIGQGTIRSRIKMVRQYSTRGQAEAQIRSDIFQHVTSIPVRRVTLRVKPGGIAIHRR